MCTENYHWHHDYVRLAWDSGFTFNIHRTRLNFDWSSIGLLDIDRVVRDRDVAIVEKYMGTILNYCLDEDQTRILDPTFVKVFQLSQLSVQYLQFCKRYLDNTVVLLKKELTRYKEENIKLNDNVEKLQSEVTDLKKNLKELKQSIQSQQPQSPESVVSTFKCNVCSKLFVSEDFLLAHFKRRHEFDSNPFQTETDRLQLEIKELKERLNSTEKFIQNDHNSKVIQEKQENIPNNDAVVESKIHVDDLKDKFDHLKQYVEQELTILRDEKHYQEKYEKWFDLVFQRLDNSKKELQEKEEIGDGDKLVRKESSTQTITENYVESETMTDEVPRTPLEEKGEPKSVIMEIDMQKIQDDIRINTESHLGQMQGVLEKKLSGGFEQIQLQMNTFWEKLSNMESEKKQISTDFTQIPQKNNTNAITVNYSIINDNQKPYLSFISSASSSESLERPVVAKNLPTPAPRIIKKFPTIIYSKPKETNVTSPVKETANIRPKAVQNFQEKYFEDTSSDDTLEVVKAPLEVASVKKVLKHDHKNAVVSSRSMSKEKHTKTRRRQAVELSDTETEEECVRKEPQIKQSTTSTLGQRSLTSLKQMVKDKDLMKGLKNELREMVNLRLKEIGISPYWTGIPEKSYKQAMHVVRHQADLSKKKYINYMKIQQSILKILNQKVMKECNNAKQNSEHKKHKENKTFIVKQSTVRKQKKHEKRLKYPADNISTDEDTFIKSNNAFAKETADKENITQVAVNIPQEKVVSVAATPVKKKVLFDLQDSSSTSKINVSSVENSQNPEITTEDKQELNFERTIISINPIKKQETKDDNIQKTSVQKPHKVLKINDGGSTTSLVSSILEAPKLKANVIESTAHSLTKEDISDWDISDILT